MSVENGKKKIRHVFYYAIAIYENIYLMIVTINGASPIVNNFGYIWKIEKKKKKERK